MLQPWTKLIKLDYFSNQNASHCDRLIIKILKVMNFSVEHGVACKTVRVTFEHFLFVQMTKNETLLAEASALQYSYDGVVYVFSLCSKYPNVCYDKIIINKKAQEYFGISINKIITIHFGNNNNMPAKRNGSAPHSGPKLNAENFCFASSQNWKIVFGNSQYLFVGYGRYGMVVAQCDTICRSHITKATICSAFTRYSAISFETWRIK